MVIRSNLQLAYAVNYPSGLSLSFEASIAIEDSPVTSHKNL